jgi:erythromycin esterase
MKKIFLSVIILFVVKILSAQNIDTIRFARWINENSIELSAKSGFKQLAEVLNDKTIVGLGECVHGSKTIDNIRFDVAKALIEHSNFNIVAFEMPFNIGLRINHFLKTGEGNIEQILMESHPFTRTSEMVDFIKWIKQYNARADKPVILYGFDVQSNVDLLKDLLKFYKKTTHKEAQNLTTTLVDIFEKVNVWESFGSQPAPFQDSVMKIVSRLVEIHALNRKDFVLNAGFIEYEHAAKRIEIWSNQLQGLNSGYAGGHKARAIGQSELVQWIKNFEGENSKIILFAHNGHLSKSVKLEPRERTLSTQGFYQNWPVELITGYYLDKAFGDEYYFSATQFGSGFFMGFDPQNEFRLSKLEVTSPEQYSLPHLLQQANKIPYFIDIRSEKARTRQIINYICSFQPFYHIGAAYDYKYAKARLINFFDAIIFIDKIEESNRLDFEK